MLRTVETEQAVAIPEFPVLLDPLARLIQHFPDIALRFLVDLVYPYPLLPTCDGEQRQEKGEHAARGRASRTPLGKYHPSLQSPYS